MDQQNHNLVPISVALGQDSRFIDFEHFERAVHKDIVNDLDALRKRAAVAGFDLALASGYRSFDQQLQIWNDKVLGKRAVLDANERPLDISQLAERELVFAILRWSALPGASRHHWGTDVDVFDAAGIDGNYQLKLTVDETRDDGPFAAFYLWLENEFTDNRFPFFRPYENDEGGVAPEPWHLSHRTVAQRCSGLICRQALTSCLEKSEILLKKEILKNIDEIFDRFVVSGG